MKNGTTKLIAFSGIMGAVIFVVLLLETQVFASILPISPCFLSIPLAVSLSIWGDWKKMFIGGTIFGFCSFFMSFMFPSMIVFANPLISIVPRVILGITAYGTCAGIKRLTAKGKSKFLRNYLPDAVAGIVGAVTNTILVVTGLYIFKFTGIEDALTLIISFNALAEIICCAILVPIIAGVIRKYYKTEEKTDEDIDDKSDGETKGEE